MRIKKFMSRGWAASLLVAAVALVGIAFAAPAPKKTKMDPPTFTTGCASADDEVFVTNGTIDLTVCAGATGAPAGFSVQWMLCDDFNNGTDLDNDGFYTSPGENAPGQWTASDFVCKASFSGNAKGYHYNLEPLECSTVTIGAILFDNPGASTNCPDDLGCGNCFKFRVFAHANSKLQRSDWSETKECSTLDCPESCSSLSQGYWKQHYPGLPAPTDETWNTILQEDGLTPGLTIGCANYTPQQLVNILNTQPAKDVKGVPPSCEAKQFIQLMHQLIASRLNLEKYPDGEFANDPAVLLAISLAEAELCSGNKCDPTDYATDLDDLIHVTSYHCGK
jgi:hypothetical protein